MNDDDDDDPRFIYFHYKKRNLPLFTERERDLGVFRKRF
jgi:hypothetical protein